MKSVYSAVRTGSLNKEFRASSLDGYVRLLRTDSPSLWRCLSLRRTPLLSEYHAGRNWFFLMKYDIIKFYKTLFLVIFMLTEIRQFPRKLCISPQSLSYHYAVWTLGRFRKTSRQTRYNLRIERCRIYTHKQTMFPISRPIWTLSYSHASLNDGDTLWEMRR